MRYWVFKIPCIAFFKIKQEKVSEIETIPLENAVKMLNTYLINKDEHDDVINNYDVDVFT